MASTEQIPPAAQTTRPGFINENRQRVIRRVGPSPSHANQYTYELVCEGCGQHYGANGCDIAGAGAGQGRRCPNCQGGAPGDPIGTEANANVPNQSRSANFTVLVERDGEWWIGTIAEIPGVFSQGETKVEMLENIEDALKLVVAANRDQAKREADSSAVMETLSVDLHDLGM